MSEFLDALQDPHVPFLRYALVVGLLASVSLGILGSYVVVRRTTYIADAIAHAVLGGIGVDLFIRHMIGIGGADPMFAAKVGIEAVDPKLGATIGMGGADPMFGAVAAALAAALGIGLVSLYAREREDTVISLVWVGGVAVGLLLLDSLGGAVDPMLYLIGDINIVSFKDIELVALLDLVVVGLVVLFHNKLAAAAFDAEFSEVRGLSAKFYYLLLLCLTSLAVVLLVRVVGSFMVVALLALPAAIAGRFVRHLWQMMVGAAVLCAALITAGLAVSYPYGLKTGPTIIVLAVAAYLLAAPIGWAVGRRA